MAINKKLVHFKTKAAFEAENNAGNILDISVVFIKETREIYTHGSFYKCLSEGEFEEKLGQYATEEYVESNYQEKGQYFDDADYNEESKEILFYQNGDVVTTLDATPFIVDNFVDDVEVIGTDLVITFNSEDKSAIRIPISDIFDSGQYYTKQEVDTISNNLNEQLTLKVDGEDFAYFMRTLQEQLSEKLSIENAEETYQHKGNYITEEEVRGNYQPLGQYADKNKLDEVISDVEDLKNSPSQNFTPNQVTALRSAANNFILSKYSLHGKVLRFTNDEESLVLEVPMYNGQAPDNDNVEILTVPTATTEADGAMSKEDKAKLDSLVPSIVTVEDTDITVEPSKYYRVNGTVDTLNIIIPQLEDKTKLQSSIISFTTGESPSVTITSDDEISYYTGYSIEPNTTYELNLIFNGVKWVIAYGVIE